MAKSNELHYYSVRALKEALVNLGYDDACRIKNKNELLMYITLLMELDEPDETYITDSDDDDSSEEIIEVNAVDILEKMREL